MSLSLKNLQSYLYILFESLYIGVRGGASGASADASGVGLKMVTVLKWTGKIWKVMKQVRIHDWTVACDWAGAVMPAHVSGTDA